MRGTLLLYFRVLYRRTHPAPITVLFITQLAVLTGNTPPSCLHLPSAEKSHSLRIDMERETEGQGEKTGSGFRFS